MIARTRRHHQMRENHQLRADAWLEENKEALRYALWMAMSPGERIIVEAMAQRIRARRELIQLQPC